MKTGAAAFILFADFSFSAQAELALTGSTDAPTPTPEWISVNAETSGEVLNGELDFTDREEAPGQSFTTSNTIGLQLDAITFIRSEKFGDEPTDLHLNFGILKGKHFTSLYEGSVNFNTKMVAENTYLTFSGFLSIPLQPSTTYAFIISRPAGTGYIGWAKNYAKDAAADLYKDGRVLNGPNTGSQESLFNSEDEFSDHSFYAQISRAKIVPKKTQ